MSIKLVKLGIVAAAAAALVPAGTAFASGSISGGASASRLGQSVYTSKIACRSCPFPGGPKTAEQAREMQAMIDNGKIALSSAERRAVKDYVAKRFKGN